MRFMNQWKIILPVAGFLVIIIASSVHLSALSAKVLVQAAPEKSTITLDGKKIRPGQHSIRPGTHTLVISKAGFASFSTTFKVAKDEKRFVGTALTPNSPETANWYQTHPADAKIAEGISSKNSDQSSQDAQAKLPIIKSLPFVDQLYRIDYGRSQAQPNNPDSVALYIKYYSDAGKQQALQYLEHKGVNPTKTEIIYINASPVASPPTTDPGE